MAEKLCWQSHNPGGQREKRDWSGPRFQIGGLA